MSNRSDTQPDPRTVLIDALYWAAQQATDQGLHDRAQQFRAVYELARDDKIVVVAQ